MISIFINSLTSGGAEKVVLTLLQNFRQTSSEFELIFIEKEQFYELPTGVPFTYLTDYQSLDKSLMKIPYLFICAFRLKNHIKQNHIKIVQSHLLRATFINTFARMLGANHHAQVVLHSRINFDDKPWFYRIFAKWIYEFVLQRADSVISICKTMKYDLDDYLNLKHHPKHIYIYNPHNICEIKRWAAEIPKDFSFAEDKKYIVSVGRLAEGKRLEDLIQAFSNLKKDNVELIFVGNGPIEKKLKQLTRKLQLEDYVHFLGYQYNPYSYLSRATIYVLSSEWEGLPNSIIEALICGTPVVSSDCVSGPREILSPDSDLKFSLKNKIEKGNYGLLYPVGNVKLLAQAINLLLKNESLRKEYIQKGFIRAKQFDAEEVAQKYLETFPSKVEE